MADEEPQQQSIKARIAALNVGQVGRAPITATQNRTSIPTPPAVKRSSTASLPASNSSVHEIGNQPNGPGGRQVLPPPTGIVRSGQANGSRAKPPPPPRVPPRSDSTASRPSPALPARRPSTQLARRESQESISSVVSSVSGFSTTASNPTRAPSIDSGRIRAPVFSPASLPPLPPKRPTQGTETNRPPLRGRQATAPVTTAVEKPIRAPALPQRSAGQPPAEPARILPPPEPPRRPAARNGLGKASLGGRQPSVPASNIIDLDPSNFDSILFGQGKPALVQFMLPYCPHCKEVVEVYEELASSFAYAVDQVYIARVDASVHKALAERFAVQCFPTFNWFDGYSETPEAYQRMRNIESFTGFVTEKTGLESKAGVPSPTQQDDSNAPSLPPRRLPPAAIPPLPSRSLPPRTINPQGLPTPDSTPPPIPAGTRPDLSKLIATKPKVPSSSITPAFGDVCFKCRDFSAVDAHAADFPRHTVQSLDWLASQLCGPFPSRTDKARAIFAWCHHNVAYDVVAFFNSNVQPSTPAKTLETGLAVCEGYAAIFVTIAVKAGLEAFLVSGHGKGYGHNALGPGDPIPPRNVRGHAWAVAKIDDDQWKLCDPCWGAGSVSGKGQPYTPGFNPSQFTMSNDEFGLSHYPGDSRHFYRDDERPSISWEEYMVGPDTSGLKPVQIYAQCKAEGFDDKEFQPKHYHISTNRADHPNGMVRFQFQRICPHWDPIRNGPGAPYLYFLQLGKKANGADADKAIMFETNGKYWWLDVPVQRLGGRAQKVQIYSPNPYNGRDGRGLTKRQFENDPMRSSMRCYMASWELV